MASPQTQPIDFHRLSEGNRKMSNTRIRAGTPKLSRNILYEQMEVLQKRVTQLEKSLDFEVKLNRIKDKVAASLEVEKVLQAVVEEVGSEFDLEYAYIRLYPRTEKLPSITYRYTQGMNGEPGTVELAEFPENLAPQPRLGEPWQVCQRLQNAPQYHGAILACPILDCHGQLGELWLLDQTNKLFNALEIEWMQQVTHQCAIALRQAYLYQTAIAELETLKQTAGLKNEFLNIVLHELRTPCTTMRMGLEMLGISLQKLNGSPAEPPLSNLDKNQPLYYVAILKAECDRQLSLISKLLDLAHLDNQDQPLLVEEIQLQNWIPYVAEPFIERTKQHQQIFALEIATDLPEISSDSFCLERIVTELLNNACKYTPRHGTITTSITFEADCIQLCVKNSGVEIPENHLPYIFDKFYRIPSADHWQQGGSGLGLALVKQLSEYLGANIWVTSADSQTCFMVQFPIHSSQASLSVD